MSDLSSYLDVIKQKQAPKQAQSSEPCSCETRVRFVADSGNGKTGHMPVSYSSRSSCPDSCPFYKDGCYAESGTASLAWDNGPKNSVKFDAKALSFELFCQAVECLPMATLWRHDIAGDLAGKGEHIDKNALIRLVEANKGRRGFTYSHKVFTSERNFALVQWANSEGFVINASCETMEQVRTAQSAGIPAVLTVGADGPSKINQDGVLAVTCPNELNKAIQCDKCQLCAKADRKFAVIFHAHGAGKAKIQTNL